MNVSDGERLPCSILTFESRSSRNPAYDSGESRPSPRDRSPGRYNDPRDSDQYRGGAARGGERRRSISEVRTSQNAFVANRDTFRDPVGRESRDFPPREPPRGPKALEVPSGPRSSTYSTDYRGDFGYRGEYRASRGRGRGNWHDDSRDRGREAERDYRASRDDRGPPSFRDDRSRDRDRWERNDSFRGRRASPPQGRARSPNYGPRENRDAPSTLDLDRARRGSRDEPLAANTPAPESLQPIGFNRGYGRGRGIRGRGRGGYHDDYHIQGPSPDPSFGRRTQPSATPPPQVPAFGSTSSNVSLPSAVPKGPKADFSDLAHGPLPGVSVPTAPRVRAPAFGRAKQDLPSAKWINPDFAAKRTTLDTPQPEKPSFTTGTQPSLPTDPANQATSPRSFPDDKQIQWRSEGEVQDKTSRHGDPSPAKPELRSPRRESSRQRRSIAGKHPAETSAKPLHETTDEGSASDSGDDFGDDFVEDDIKKVEEELAKANDESINPALPRDEPNAFYLQPFMEFSIEKQVGDQINTAPETCVPMELPQLAPELKALQSNLSVKPKSKGRSRPNTPQIDPEAAARPKPNNQDVFSQPEAQIPLRLPDLTREQPTMSNIQQSTSSDHAGPGLGLVDQKVKSEATGRPVSYGMLGKSAPMETFDESESEQESEIIEPTEDDIVAVRKKMITPPLSTLPDFSCKRWDQDEEFLRTLEEDPAVEAFIMHRIAQLAVRKERAQEEAAQQWKERYLAYRQWTDFSNDPDAVRSREKFAQSREIKAAEAAASLTQPPVSGSKPEPQRRTGSRWATEHDLERVLRESEQEARETKEREERFARAQTASAKEAKIPDMCWNEEERIGEAFADRSHLVHFERAFAILEFGEPIDNFTDEEALNFEKAYLETPKQWGKVAEALPRRDYKSCIQHYYLVKRTTQLKEKVKKQPKRRKRVALKGAKPKSNALMADIVSRDEGEDGTELENGGERRRPRRAAAPTFAFEATPGDSEAPSPAPTPGRKAAATPNNGGESAGSKRRSKTAREKAPKQSKNSQLLAAAPTPTSRGAGSLGLLPNLTAGRGSVGTNAFPAQYDGASASPSMFIPPHISPAERASNSIASTFDIMSQPFADQERLGSAPPMGFDAQNDRRNPQQTSSYWSKPERDEFPALLQHFGTDWGAIARFMTSKTHVMVYTTAFKQWLAVPSDENKSWRVANIETQVKNYYSRQVESGKMSAWERMARDADEKKARGESTGPTPTPIPKNRFEAPPGPIPRSGSAMDIDDISSAGQNTMMQQASPPQPTLSTRFPALAQAGPVSHTVPQPASQAPLLSKHAAQQPAQQGPQQMQPQNRPRGPALGYFNAEPQRPIMQATNTHQNQSTLQMQDAVSQRSLMVAQEAHLERQQALRLEREQQQAQAQAQQAQAQQAQAQQAQAQAQAQARAHQQAMQKLALERERQLQMKQESDLPNPHQFEPYSNASIRSSAISAHSRPEVSQSISQPEIRRTAPPLQQYPPQNHPAVRSYLSDSTNREMKPSPSPALPRAPMSAPPASQEQYTAPPPARLTPVATVRQQETVRKTSSIMSLLNDEPSEPRPQRVNDGSSTVTQASQTPPPQHSLQNARYSAQSSQPTSQPPQNPHQMAQLPPQHQPSQIQHAYTPTGQQLMHQHTSSLGQSRSYTPNSFEQRSYAPPQSIQQQQPSMYAQPPRHAIDSQPPPLRREPSIGEVHGVTSGYARTSTSSQPSMRLKESPYSATPPPSSQPGRQQIASPLDLAQPAERDYYSRQPSYLMQQPSTAAGSPQLGPSYHSQTQQQQPSHRQVAFGQGPSHTTSPPTSYATHHPLHRSRQNSFDGRYPSTASSAPSQQGFIQAPQHQGTPHAMQYQQQHQAHSRFETPQERERRLFSEEQYQHRLDQQRLDQQRLEQQRLEEQQRRRAF